MPGADVVTSGPPAALSRQRRSRRLRAITSSLLYPLSTPAPLCVSYVASLAPSFSCFLHCLSITRIPLYLVFYVWPITFMSEIGRHERLLVNVLPLHMCRYES